MTTAPNRRPAFTLVEMLVASALIIFMMYIITTAFQSGLASFHLLKAQGDLQEKLRQAGTIMRTDLAAPHFGGNFVPTTQGPFLGDQRLNDHTWTPPEKGYFRIAMPDQIGLWAGEGFDPDAPPGTSGAVQYVRLSEAA